MTERIVRKMRPTRLNRFYGAGIFLWGLSAFLFFDPTRVIVDWRLAGFRLQPYLVAAFGILGLVFLLIGEVSRIPVKYTLTDRRIIKRKGIIRIEENSVPLNKVERITLIQGVFARILNYGEIQVDTGEIDEERLMLPSVPKVKLVQQLIQQELSRLVAPSRPVPRRPAAPTPPAITYGSPWPPPASPTMAGSPPRPISSLLAQPPVNPPAPAGWEAADAEVQNLERQLREDRDFLLKLDTSLLDGRIDNATYSEEKRSRTDHIAELERRITERRDERKPHH